jgi:hypothetical protein
MGRGVGKSWTARNSGVETPEANTVWVPSGVNFKISPADMSATKRLPLRPNAKSLGPSSSVANSVSYCRMTPLVEEVSHLQSEAVYQIISSMLRCVTV